MYWVKRVQSELEMLTCQFETWWNKKSLRVNARGKKAGESLFCRKKPPLLELPCSPLGEELFAHWKVVGTDPALWWQSTGKFVLLFSFWKAPGCSPQSGRAAGRGMSPTCHPNPSSLEPTVASVASSGLISMCCRLSASCLSPSSSRFPFVRWWWRWWWWVRRYR